MAWASRPEFREPPVPDELILRAQGGDRRALKELIQRYQARIAKFVLSQTRDSNACEDLSQAIFVKMVIGLPRLREEERFESWLFQIGRNVCRDHLRARLGWRRFFAAYHESHEGIAAAEENAGTESTDRLENGLARLPVEDRTLLRLHFEEKRSYKEIAQLSNTTVSAVKSRLYRARRGLRGLLLAGNSE